MEGNHEILCLCPDCFGLLKFTNEDGYLTQPVSAGEEFARSLLANALFSAIMNPLFDCDQRYARIQ
jgi:hypothetical protein